MLDFPIVDTHLHVWDPQLLRYSWLDDVPLLNKAYLLEDYDRACGPINVGKMVFLQAEVDSHLFMDEAEWVNSLADQDERLQGIVPWAPLEMEMRLVRSWRSWRPNRESRASAASFS